MKRCTHFVPSAKKKKHADCVPRTAKKQKPEKEPFRRSRGGIRKNVKRITMPLKKKPPLCI